MKILIVISEIKYSGAAKIASWLANNLSENDYDVSLLTFIDGEDCQNIHNSIKRIKIISTNTSRFYRTINTIYSIRKLIIKNKYDLILSFLPLEGFISIFASLFTKTKVVVSERSDPYHERTTVANISRFFFRFADGAVFQSLGAQNYFPDILKKKSTIIENPIIKPKINVIPYKKRNDEIVSVSRLYIHQKRQDILLKAFSIVHTKNTIVKLKLIGDGPDEAFLKNLVKKLKIENNVLFLGKSKDVLNEIKTAKIFILTSDYEGMPNALLEALSMGIPAVSTDYSPGGVKEIIETRKRGYVVPCGNSEQLAEKILQLLNNEEETNNMAKNAETICNEYSEKEIYKKWCKYIRQICNY